MTTDETIREIRQYLILRNQNASLDKLGGGRTELWLRILINEVDRLSSFIKNK